MDVANKIQLPKSGTDFLSASHFVIGHEPQWLANRNPTAFKSTFKHDYPPQALGEREKTTHLPPAKIMHRDERIGNDHLSVTKEHYGMQPISRTGYQDLPYALSKTNFKMDADEKIKSFRTTQNDHYYKKSLEEAQNVPLRTDWTKSCIPQGDKEKIGWEKSAYKSSFVPFGPVLKPIKHSGVLEGPPTIQGDERVHNSSLYGTSTKDFYGSKYQKRITVDESIRYPATKIPQGDREKCVYLSSTQQDDFRSPGVDFESKERNEGLKKLQSTSFIMGDERLASYNTTAQDSYQSVASGGRRRSNAKGPRSKSNFPQGDGDILKNIERFSTTTNNSQFKSPPSDFCNPKVDGSNLRTASNVHFGNDDQLTSYKTTMKDNFKVLKGTCEKACGSVHKSSIPTDYYKNHVGQATYETDFKANDESGTMSLNPAVIAKLKGSSVKITDSSFHEFNTTHKTTYTPKENSRDRVTDTGKLQKSSVPIGTLQI